MTVNNLCSGLIVYGSYARGGKNHHIFADLPGEWIRGKILVNLIDSPDGIGPGDNQEIEAWAIKFSDCLAEMFTPEYEKEKRLLFERWSSLDLAMGKKWARNEIRWWPEGSEPIAGANGMIVVNAYVPLENYPYLEGRDDVPSPDEADDFFGMWRRVKSGEKRYDWSKFIALIKDIIPDQYAELFGGLPQCGEFISKLNTFYADHRLGGGNLLLDAEGDFRLYVTPLKKNALPGDELIVLAKTDIAERAKLLRVRGLVDEAEALANLHFRFGTPPAEVPQEDDPTADALDKASEFLSDSEFHHDEHWVYCLDEACYGIAASFELRDWLMSQWRDIEFDFGPRYQLWRAGGTYEVRDGICYVAERHQ